MFYVVFKLFTFSYFCYLELGIGFIRIKVSIAGMGVWFPISTVSFSVVIYTNIGEAVRDIYALMCVSLYGNSYLFTLLFLFNIFFLFLDSVCVCVSCVLGIWVHLFLYVCVCVSAL